MFAPIYIKYQKSDVDLLGEFVEQALSLVGAYALQLDSKSNRVPPLTMVRLVWNHFG